MCQGDILPWTSRTPWTAEALCDESVGLNYISHNPPYMFPARVCHKRHFGVRSAGQTHRSSQVVFYAHRAGEGALGVLLQRMHVVIYLLTHLHGVGSQATAVSPYLDLLSAL